MSIELLATLASSLAELLCLNEPGMILRDTVGTQWIARLRHTSALPRSRRSRVNQAAMIASRRQTGHRSPRITVEDVPGSAERRGIDHRRNRSGFARTQSKISACWVKPISSTVGIVVLFEVGHDDFGRIANEEAIGHAPASRGDLRQQVMRHLLLVEDAVARDRPGSARDDLSPVGLASRNDLSRAGMIAPVLCR